MRTPEEAKAITRRFYEDVIDAHDLKAADGMIAENAIERNPLSPDMGNDKAAALATLQALFDNSPDLKSEILDMIATGDRVATRARFTGTDSGKGWGAMMGAGPTGKTLSVEGIDVVVIGEDGRFVEHYGIFDAPGMMQQLGLMPAPGGGMPPA
jgi:predicted ester cyclase